MGIMDLESEFLLFLTMHMVRKYKIRSVIPAKPYMPAPPPLSSFSLTARPWMLVSESNINLAPFLFNDTWAKYIDISTYRVARTRE